MAVAESHRPIEYLTAFVTSTVAREEVTDPDDAAHLAQAGLRPWIRFVVTSDRKFRSRAARADIDGLTVITVSGAVELLQIEPGERPPITPYKPWVIPRVAIGGAAAAPAGR